MDLRKTVKRFATESYTDPYTVGATALKGRITTFNEVTNSGQSARRRILELQPSYNMFSNRVIVAGADTYIVGTGNDDYWKGNVIRVKYPLLPVGATSKVASVLQILTSAIPSRTVYAHPTFTKDISLEKQESDLYSNFTIFFSSAESVVKGQILIHGTTNYYRVRNVPFVDNAGFLVADTVFVESPVQTLNFSSTGGYDPATDTIAVASTTSITAFVEEAYLHFDNTSERFSEIKPGDKAISIKPVTTPKAGDKIGAYNILSIDTVNTVSVCHCRP